MGTVAIRTVGVGMAPDELSRLANEVGTGALFISAQAWGKTAELIRQYLHKGSPAIFDGRLEPDKGPDESRGQGDGQGGHSHAVCPVWYAQHSRRVS